MQGILMKHTVQPSATFTAISYNILNHPVQIFRCL